MTEKPNSPLPPPSATADGRAEYVAERERIMVAAFDACSHSLGSKRSRRPLCYEHFAQALDTATAEKRGLIRDLTTALENSNARTAQMAGDYTVVMNKLIDANRRTAQMEQQLGLARERIAWLESLMPGVNP